MPHWWLLPFVLLSALLTLPVPSMSVPMPAFFAFPPVCSIASSNSHAFTCSVVNSPPTICSVALSTVFYHTSCDLSHLCHCLFCCRPPLLSSSVIAPTVCTPNPVTSSAVAHPLSVPLPPLLSPHHLCRCTFLHLAPFPCLLLLPISPLHPLAISPKKKICMITDYCTYFIS